jgi:Cysteine dioxygenase type I
VTFSSDLLTPNDPWDLVDSLGVATLMREPELGRAPTRSSVQRPGPQELVRIAEALAARAPRWRGIDLPLTRRWELLEASEAFEAWLIAWPPGGSTDLHDHGDSAGAVTVADGELLETSVARTYSDDLALRRRTLHKCTTLSIGEGHIHDVVNVSSTHAISVHVYAPPLISMTYYRVADGKLEPHRTVSCARP